MCGAEHTDYNHRGFAVVASARRINHPPNEVWRPRDRINGNDESPAWSPRDRSVVFATEQAAVTEPGNRAAADREFSTHAKRTRVRRRRLRNPRTY
jgi:Tol biopolymer transport system component